jgi:hypothetical protein
MAESIRSFMRKLGDRGLVVYDKGDSYSYIFEDDWMAFVLTTPDQKYKDLVALKAAVAKPSGVLIDFAALKVPKRATQDPQPNGAAVQNGVVIHEGGKYYGIPDSALKPLPPGSEGDAGAVVERGGLVAGIPNSSIPLGTYCVLINRALMSDL